VVPTQAIQRIQQVIEPSDNVRLPFTTTNNLLGHVIRISPVYCIYIGVYIKHTYCLLIAKKAKVVQRKQASLETKRQLLFKKVWVEVMIHKTFYRFHAYSFSYFILYDSQWTPTTSR